MINYCETVQQTERPPAPEGLCIQNVGGTDTTTEHEGKDRKSGKYMEMKKVNERNGSVDWRREGFRLWLWETPRRNLYICGIATWLLVMWSTRSRTVGHVGRLSNTQTFVSLHGFSVMFPPLGKERSWTLSFVTGFFFFFCCVSTFLILDSGCIVFDVHCTFPEMHCVLYIALFSVSCQAFRHWVDLTSSLITPPPKKIKNKNTQIHTISALSL